MASDRLGVIEQSTPDRHRDRDGGAGLHQKIKQRFVAAGLLAIAALGSFLLAHHGQGETRGRFVASAADRQAQSLDTTLGAAAALSRVLALALSTASDPKAASDLLSEAVDRQSLALAATFSDADGRMVLMHRRDGMVWPNLPNFVEAAPRRSVGGATLLRAAATGPGQELLAVRTVTNANVAGHRGEVMVILRFTDLPSVEPGLTCAWLFAADGALVAGPTGSDAQSTDLVLRAWMAARPQEATGQIEAIMPDGPHALLYRRLPGWPLALVFDSGLIAQTMPREEAATVAISLAALLALMLGLRLLHHSRRPDPAAAELEIRASGFAGFDEPLGARNLAGVMAHEVNNLLTIVSFDAEMLSEMYPLDRALQRITGSMLAAAARGTTLTRDLLSYAERALLRPQLLDIAVEIAGRHQLLSDCLVPGQILSVHMPKLGEKRLLVAVDPEAFVQSLSVLLRIASEAAGPMAEIDLEIGAHEQGGRDFLKVVVDDPGPGCDELGEPLGGFASRSYSQGLGLAAVAGFARQSGGVLRLESQPGLGTRACLLFPVSQVNELPRAEVFRFPAAPRTPSRSNAAQRSPVLRSPVRVLLVDDAAAVRESIARRLRAVGFDVVEARDVSHAEQIAANGIDVLLTEIVLNDAIDGWTLAARARQRAPDLPVVFMSGFMSARQPEVMRSDDLASFVRKPVEAEELRLVIDGLLALRESHRLAEAAD